MKKKYAVLCALIVCAALLGMSAGCGPEIKDLKVLSKIYREKGWEVAEPIPAYTSAETGIEADLGDVKLAEWCVSGFRAIMGRDIEVPDGVDSDNKPKTKTIHLKTTVLVMEFDTKKHADAYVALNDSLFAATSLGGDGRFPLMSPRNQVYVCAAFSNYLEASLTLGADALKIFQEYFAVE